MEIPVLRINRTVGTRVESLTRDWKDRSKHKGVESRQNRFLKLKCDGERNRSSEVSESILSRKAAIALYVPVP